jgi:hypothetical protein
VPGGAQKKLAEELEDSLDRELYSPGARAHQEEEEEEVVLLEPQQGAQGQLVHQAQQGRASDSEEESEREESEEGNLSDSPNSNQGAAAVAELQEAGVEQQQQAIQPQQAAQAEPEEEEVAEEAAVEEEEEEEEEALQQNPAEEEMASAVYAGIKLEEDMDVNEHLGSINNLLVNISSVQLVGGHGIDKRSTADGGKAIPYLLTTLENGVAATLQNMDGATPEEQLNVAVYKIPDDNAPTYKRFSLCTYQEIEHAIRRMLSDEMTVAIVTGQIEA